jgi:predicted Zn-dependent protease
MTTRKLAGLAALLLLLTLPGVPQSSRAQIYNDVEAQLRVNWLQMKRDWPQHPSARVQRYAQCIAWAIIEQVPQEFQDLNWEIIVFDTGGINASVTPEGKIAVLSGLLEVADTPDKLAAVLGHEVAHLTQGHVAERAVRMGATGFVGMLGSMLTGLPGGDAQQGAQVIMQLPFQRGQETEADLVGMEFMARAGYNPAAVLPLWATMAEKMDDNSVPEWLSSHPDPEFRRQDMAANLSPSLRIYNESLDAGVRPRCTL